ncbi:MAG: hypothetical protein JNL02_18365 [Saprospiraceae bacterium]|nr:hypothetical protein [Saprospiraceae bacterium]
MTAIRILLHVGLFCFWASLAHAQKIHNPDATKTITFDFQQKSITPIKKGSLRDSNWYWVKVTGVNLNLYKVSVNQTDTVTEKPLPPLSFGATGLEDLTKVVAGIGEAFLKLPTAGEEKNFEPSQVDVRLLEYQMLTFVQIPKTVEDTLLQHQRLTEDHLFELNQLKIRIDQVRHRADTVQLNAINPRSPSPDTSYGSILKEVEAIRAGLVQLSVSIRNSKTTFDQFMAANAELDDDTQKVAQAIAAAYTALLAKVMEVYESINAQKTNELLTPLVHIQNLSSGEYLSMPFQYKGNETHVDITLTPKVEGYPTYKTRYTFPFPKQNYAAVGLSFYASGLFDDAYSTVASGNGSGGYTYQLADEEPPPVELGTALLLRMGKKFNKTQTVGVHFTFGPGLSMTRQIRPRFLLGGGISFGKKHMLSIDAGLIAGPVERLSRSVDTRQVFDAPPDDILVSRLSAKAFVAIGYVYKF